VEIVNTFILGRRNERARKEDYAMVGLSFGRAGNHFHFGDYHVLSKMRPNSGRDEQTSSEDLQDITRKIGFVKDSV
jgi:hypothetical protein